MKAPKRVFKSQGGAFPGWCANCGKHRSLHRNWLSGKPEFCKNVRPSSAEEAMKAPKRVKPTVAYAEVGSHGGIFTFCAGPVYELYGDVMQIYAKSRPGLVPVKITALRLARPRRSGK